MPYVEILGPYAAAPDKHAAAVAVTEGVTASFGVPASTVTVYFHSIPDGDYAHAGALGRAGGPGRLFVKVHAYRRALAERRACARALTPAIARCYGVPAEDVAVYFFDRELDEVAHGGLLSCDDPDENVSLPLTTAP